MTVRGVHAWADNQDYFQAVFAPLHHLPHAQYWLLGAHSLGIYACGALCFFILRRRSWFAALAVAADNAARHGVADRVSFVESDLLAAPDLAGPWDAILSNPPYVREDEFASLPRDVRDHEPRSALVAGPTGVEVVERLARQAVERLAPGGWLLVEIGPAVAAAAEGVIAAVVGLEPAPTLKDLAGLPRIVQARRA